MVLGGDDRVAGAALGDQVGPQRRIVLGGGELLALLHVVVERDIAVVESPALGGLSRRVDAPVDEDTELGARKPLHAFGLLLGRLGPGRREGRPQQQAEENYGFEIHSHYL